MLFALLTTLFLYTNGYLLNLENALFDLQTKWSRTLVESDLVLVEVDSYSIKKLHNWPWPRSHHAQVLKNLQQAGAKKIFFDIDFSSRSNAKNDEVFAKVLQNSVAYQVLLPTFLQYNNTQENRRLTLIRPLPEFIKGATPVSVNLRPESDGLVRSIKLLGRFASFELQTAPVLLSGYDPVLDESMRINFRIEPSSFKRISYADVFLEEFDPDFFNSKNVIIGSTALELSDQIPVPVYQSIAGPIVQAMAYQSIKMGKLKNVSEWVVYLSLLLLMLVLRLFVGRHGWRTGAFASLLLMTFTFFTSLTLYTQFNIIYEIAPLLLFLVLGFVFRELARIDQQTLSLLTQSLVIRKKDAMMASVVENTSEGILTLDGNGNIQSINPSAKDIFGLVDESLSGQSLEVLISGLTKVKDKKEFLATASLQEDTGIHQLKGEFPIEFSSNSLALPNQIMYTVFVRDITKRKEQERNLKYQASHDCLTELYNRSALVSNIRESITAYHEKNQKTALLIIDLDRFKEINDTLGHGVGDKVLQEIGDRLDDFSKHNVMVARIGGDEFGVLIRDVKGMKQTEEVIKKIISVLKKPFHSDDISLQIGASIGIALLPEHSEKETELMMYGDVAMYQAKKNRLDYSIYDSKYNNYTVRNLSISGQIKQAIEDEQFEMYFQPKVDLRTHKVISFEALIRWHHPMLGFVSPDDFILVAEQSGHIKPLTFYTLQKSLNHYKLMLENGYDISIAVNLSAMLLQDVSLVPDIEEAMKKCHSNTTWLELEITESAIVSDPERALEMLHQIRDLGIHLSIDDFGTGYASLSYLKQLPVNQLKVDKYFIQELVENKSDQIIVKSTIDLSHSLGLEVVAEGVESEEIYNMLADYGCDTAQGYWVSKPMPSSEVLEWLKIWEEKCKSLPERTATLIN